ncbi:MAG: hypothetical protein ACPGUD_06165 [Parashewanella sp.]
MFLKSISSINRLLIAAALGLMSSNLFAATIPMHLQCTVRSDMPAPAILTMPRYLGFFFVNSDVKPNDISGLFVNDPKTGSYFDFLGLHNSSNYTVELNKLVTDQQSNQQVRRYKIQFGSPQQESNFSALNSKESKQLGAQSDTVQISGQVEYCLTHPHYQEDLNAEVKLITGSEDEGYNQVSKPGVEVTDDAIPVDFKGGENSPLSIFIESGIKETGINYLKALEKNKSFNEIYLTLKPSDNEPLLPGISQAIGYISHLPYYTKGHAIGSYLEGTTYQVKPDSINIKVSDLNKDSWGDTDFYTLPTVLETQDYKIQVPQNDSVYGAPTPKPGWYLPDVTVRTPDGSAAPGTFVPVKSLTQVPAAISRNDSKESIEIAELLQSGSAFQNQFLDPGVFRDGRFYIVDSIDSDGRVKLRKIEPNEKNAKPEYLDFTQISNGDITWWGSRLRWLIKDETGHDKVQEGYIGWHSPDGSYAFLNLNDGTKSLATLPKKGDVIGFEFAKTNQ